jgi:hypothetical protein
MNEASWASGVWALELFFGAEFRPPLEMCFIGSILQPSNFAKDPHQ